MGRDIPSLDKAIAISFIPFFNKTYFGVAFFRTTIANFATATKSHSCWHKTYSDEIDTQYIYIWSTLHLRQCLDARLWCA